MTIICNNGWIYVLESFVNIFRKDKLQNNIQKINEFLLKVKKALKVMYNSTDHPKQNLRAYTEISRKHVE